MSASNPLLQPWTADHGLPPFDVIEAAHFAPAFEQALREHRAELEAIAAQPAPPSFDNTVAAFDASGRLLKRLEPLFRNLVASESTVALQEVERELVPRLAAHESAVHRHAGVFARLEALHARRTALGLEGESLRLLERVHLDFVRAGARLAPAAQQRHAAIVERLATLSTRFGQNLLADEAGWVLWLRDEADLDGLPDDLRGVARAAAAQRGHPQAWAITLSRAVVLPFLGHSTRRELREQVWRAWVGRGEGTLVGTAHDNRPVATEIMALRLELARLLGRASYADHALADRMAGTPQAVRALLERVWAPALRRAAEERAALRELARAEGGPAVLQAWDWRFYAQRLRQSRHRLDDAELKPYFSLDRMLESMFDCAQRLFGLAFTERRDLPRYHPDVRLWEVREAASGAPVGVFIGDNFARPGKRGGAWMGAYRWQSALGGGTRPLIVNNNNFAPAPPGRPALLGVDEVRTLFHEFGHALHGLLSQVRHERLSGANVLRDFIELPSQLFERWALEPAVLRRHARHVDTGAAMPEALIARLRAARHGEQGFETVLYTAAALVDLALHERESMEGLDLDAFEAAERERLGVPADIGLMHRLPQFRHLFAGEGYAAGYYAYLWAEVLDADAHEAFVEAGDLFDTATARRLLTRIYAVGDSVEPGAAYRAFRGRDAGVEPMLRQRGLLP